jgi:hypothetical protein
MLRTSNALAFLQNWKKDPLLWLVRINWLILPLSLGDMFDKSLTDSTGNTQVLFAAYAWLIWFFVLTCTLIRRAWSLTAVRIAAPLTLVATILTATASTLNWVAFTHSCVIIILVFLPELGNSLVDGLSYGNERRLLLRCPSALYLGPLPLAWLMTVSGAWLGPIFLLNSQWFYGSISIFFGIPIAVAGIRSMHQLSKRWIIFVPNGFVLHDLLSSREPFLIRRADLSSLGAIETGDSLDSEGLLDISQNALGAVLQASIDGEVEVVPQSRRIAEVKAVKQVLFCPTRPGAALKEAANRNLPRL